MELAFRNFLVYSGANGDLNGSEMEEPPHVNFFHSIFSTVTFRNKLGNIMK
jgi:hypothetical protein